MFCGQTTFGYGHPARVAIQDTSTRSPAGSDQRTFRRHALRNLDPVQIFKPCGVHKLQEAHKVLTAFRLVPESRRNPIKKDSLKPSGNFAFAGTATEISIYSKFKDDPESPTLVRDTLALLLSYTYENVFHTILLAI